MMNTIMSPTFLISIPVILGTAFIFAGLLRAIYKLGAAWQRDGRR